MIALLIIWPILAIITIGLHFANKDAGAFFFQERPDNDEKIFMVNKFKSMTDERDALKDLSHIMMNDYLKADICIIGSASRKFRRYRLP